MQLPQITEARGIRVLTSRQIAEKYGTDTDIIKKNFSNNRKRFVEGKHYIALQNQELREFKNKVNNVHLVGKTAKILYLWTEKGALLHAKSLNTDKAWEVYEYLVDFYFRAQEEKIPAETKPAPAEKLKPGANKLPQMDNPLRTFKVLLKVVEDRGIQVGSFPFGSVRSMLKDNRIGINTGMTLEEVTYELAWELVHAFIHYDGGDMINSPLSKDYNEQATRGADMIIKLLNVRLNQM